MEFLRPLETKDAFRARGDCGGGLSATTGETEAEAEAVRGFKLVAPLAANESSSPASAETEKSDVIGLRLGDANERLGDVGGALVPDCV